MISYLLALGLSAVTAPPTPLLSDARTAAGYDKRLAGQWQSKGYGYVLDIAGEHRTLYHVAGGLCLKDPHAGGDPDGLFVQWQARKNGHIALTPGPDETLYDFERIRGLPATCRSPEVWTPEKRFAFVTAALRTHYPSFERVGVDWRKLMKDIRTRHPHLDTDEDLWEALTEVYKRLDEPHSEVSNGHATVAGGQAGTIVKLGDASAVKTWLSAYRDGILNDILDGRGHHVANQKIFWGRRGDIGYLNIVTMGGYTADDGDDRAVLDAVLDEAITAFAGAKAVIVDVSNNRGGYDSTARAIASRFTAESHLAYTKLPAATPDATPQAFYVRPSQRLRYTGPVYVLTSDITVSAGEVFVMTMKALPNATTVGITTRGAFSDQIPKPLDNGWTFTLSAEIYRDAQGRWPEGRGITPDRRLDVYGGADPLKSHAQAVLRLINQLDK